MSATAIAGYAIRHCATIHEESELRHWSQGATKAAITGEKRAMAARQLLTLLARIDIEMLGMSY